jgi:endonuclease G
MKTATKYLIVLIIGFIAGAACEYWFLTYVWPKRHLSYSWYFALRNHRKPGAPCDTDQVLDRQGYSLGYSYPYKSALWVSYIISPGSVGVDVRRHGSFYEDRDIPEKYRVESDQYVNSGYDKGHLAPSATIDFNETANRETFAMSNVVPQEPKLNRRGWGKLEDLVRDWTATKGKLYVVTGPLYSDDPEMMNGLPVPERMYKVIYAYKADQAIGFIFPNDSVKNDEIWKYAVSVQEVEQQTGLTFFSKFSQKKQERLKAGVDPDWWKE